MAPAVHHCQSKERSFRMSDPSTYWLTITNAALGMVVLVCCAAVAVGVFQELAAKRRKATSMSKIDREVSDLVASFQDGHAFHLPELGVTMADGGEPLDKPLGKKEEN
jgi:hypothetical protein